MFKHLDAARAQSVPCGERVGASASADVLLCVWWSVLYRCLCALSRGHFHPCPLVRKHGFALAHFCCFTCFTIQDRSGKICYVPQFKHKMSLSDLNSADQGGWGKRISDTCQTLYFSLRTKYTYQYITILNTRVVSCAISTLATSTSELPFFCIVFLYL